MLFINFGIIKGTNLLFFFHSQILMQFYSRTILTNFIFLCSFAISFIMYMSVGVVGYLIFGNKVESQFTLNMPKELYASKIAIWTTVRNKN